MILRSALLLGSVAPDDQPAFDAYMRDVVVPEIGTYPGIREVTLRKLVQADDGAPPVYMQFDLLFDSLADMDAALASPVRTAVRDRIKEGMAPFNGTVTHVVSEAIEG
ncbi:EthD family reductase [Rhodobacter sp. NTK016B]|uniref:EthD family reductase n=1 Tax=Rhodobacter sp. NTK016B TaxID=2759676 RepID=UPI001A8E0A65|nr:EthD family reductase [Rhodobacter sp. NTK016B]MBN8293375.1 EthD family reductase [Rhodobacter sp. NTK016B]